MNIFYNCDFCLNTGFTKKYQLNNKPFYIAPNILSWGFYQIKKDFCECLYGKQQKCLKSL
jgi:hypothetical protein